MKGENRVVFISVLRILHILSAIAMVGGVFARQIVRRQAGRSTDVRELAVLTAAATRIERLLVIPGSSSAILFGAALGLSIGAPVLGFTQGGDRNWLLAANIIILSILVLIPAVFLPQRRRIDSALQGALQAGRVTPELQAALSENSGRFWHTYENVAVVLIVLLMSLRPF
jgi:hypothetical protein